MSEGPYEDAQPDAVAPVSLTQAPGDPLAELMRQGDLPAALDPGTPASIGADDAGSVAVPPRPLSRRWPLGVLLGLDIALLVVVIAWPFATPAPRPTPDAGERDVFALGDQGLVRQAVAQAAAGRFDAAIVDLELHLASHPGLGATERRLVNRALAIFAAHAGRADDAAAFVARLGDASPLRAQLAAAAAAERAGDREGMRAHLGAIVGAGDAPPSLLAEVARLLLRAGDGTPLEVPGEATGR